MYFCCLEAIQNAGKHAGADAHITVTIGHEDGMLRFEVADDGAGFDHASVAAGHGFVNMEDRLGAFGGTLTVRSRVGSGTTVEGGVPAERPQAPCALVQVAIACLVRLAGGWGGASPNKETSMTGSLRRRGPTAIAVTLAFLAGGGAAVTAQNLITSADIKDGTIKAADLANGAVNSNKIANQTVANADLANNAVGSAKISDGAVATADIANAAVNSNKITNQSVASGPRQQCGGFGEDLRRRCRHADIERRGRFSEVANGRHSGRHQRRRRGRPDALSGVRAIMAPGGGWSAPLPA